jgi:hypothetical protein
VALAPPAPTRALLHHDPRRGLGHVDAAQVAIEEADLLRGEPVTAHVGNALVRPHLVAIGDRVVGLREPGLLDLAQGIHARA